MRLTFLLPSIVILSAASASASIIVTASPLVVSSAFGSTVTVQVGISGLGLHASPSVGAYDLNLAFNPSVLSFTGVQFGDTMQGDQLNLAGSGTVSDFTNSSNGMVEFYEISLDPAALLDTRQSDRFVMATFEFNAIGTGQSGLLPGVNSIADSAGLPLSVYLQASSVDIVATPEPNTSAVLLPLVALLAWRFKRSPYGGYLPSESVGNMHSTRSSCAVMHCGVPIVVTREK